MIEADFARFAVMLVMAAVAGFLATRLRQPLIVAFIGVGIVAGPVGFGWVEADDEVGVLAKLGIAVLLFLVGLKLDLHLIRTTGPVALVTGLGQVGFTSGVGFVIALALGMDATTALYVAVALTFSSTIIIVKLLSDKRELDELHGRIAIGFLIVQDIVVVLVMIGLSAFGAGDEGVATRVVEVVLTGTGLLAATAATAKWVFPRLLPVIARSSELLVLFGVAWAVALAALSDSLGFSSEVGAFLAGVALASTRYREALGARLVSLRDFLLLFFFLDLGSRLEFADAGRQLVEAGVLSAFVLIGNPLIVLIIMGAMGYRARTSFLAGLAVAQISEFSLILAALGLSLGHIDSPAASLVTVVGLITISVSTYLILSSKQIFERLAPWLRMFERSKPSKPETAPAPEPVDVVLFGLGRFGATLAEMFREAGHDILVVDVDPQAVAKWDSRGVRTLFGDASDRHLLESLPLSGTPLIVSAMPAVDVNVPLLHGLHGEGYGGKVAIVARHADDLHRYEAEGADLVLEPFSVTGATLLDVVADSERPDDH